MKYKIIAFVLFSTLGTAAFAQFEDDPKKNQSYSSTQLHKGGFEYGLQHSINFTSLVGDYPIKESVNSIEEMKPVGARFTFDIGMFGNYYVAEKMSIQFEFNLSYMGAHTQTTRTIYQDLGIFKDTKSESFAFHYIKIPLTLNYNLTDNLYIQGGGYFSSLLSAKKFDYYYGPFDRTKLDYIAPIDLGIIGGIGFNTKIVRISMRYNFGLVDVFNDPEYPNTDLRNSVFQIVGHWLIYSDVRKRMKYENN